MEGSSLPRSARTFARLVLAAVADRDLEVRIAHLGLERLRGVLGDQEPVRDDPHAVGELVRLLQVLRGQEDRRAVVVQGLDLLPDRLAADRVEAGGRLVEEEDSRLVDERGRQVEPAAHPARVGADAPIGRVVDVNPVEQRVGALLALGARKSVQGRLKPDELAAGHERVERRLLERDADRLADLARLGDDVVARDLRGAARGAQERGEHADRGRLAGAVRAEEGVDLALGDVEVDAAHGLYLVSELPFQPPNLDRSHWRPSLGSRLRGECAACTLRPGWASLRESGRCAWVSFSTATRAPDRVLPRESRT